MKAQHAPGASATSPESVVVLHAMLSFPDQVASRKIHCMTGGMIWIRA